MKILLLEDTLTYAESLKRHLSGSEIDLATNLPDFDYLLYEEPGVQAYDLVLMDLNIVMSDISNEELREYIAELRTYEPNTVFGIPLLGLDYFHCKVLTHSATKDCAEKKFFLISGHVTLLQRDKTFEERKIIFPPERLLDKGLEGHASHLRQLANKVRRQGGAP